MLISISDSTSTDPAAYVSAQGFDWTFGSSDQAAKLYDARGLPTTVFIDREGNVVDTALGMMEPADFEARLAKIL